MSVLGLGPGTCLGLCLILGRIVFSVCLGLNHGPNLGTLGLFGLDLGADIEKNTQN